MDSSKKTFIVFRNILYLFIEKLNGLFGFSQLFFELNFLLKAGMGLFLEPYDLLFENIDELLLLIDELLFVLVVGQGRRCTKTLLICRSHYYYSNSNGHLKNKENFSYSSVNLTICL